MTLRHVLKASVRISRFLVWVDHMHYSDNRTDKYRRQDRSQVRYKRIESKREVRECANSAAGEITHVTLGGFHVLGIPAFDHEVSRVYQ